MEQIEMANEILSSIEYPISAKYYFDESGASLISSDDQNYKITLGKTFFVKNGKSSSLINNNEEIINLELATIFSIKSIKINSFFIMEIYLDSYLILNFPGIYFGWGVYKDGRQIIQHEGWKNGIELGESIDV